MNGKKWLWWLVALALFGALMVVGCGDDGDNGDDDNPTIITDPDDGGDGDDGDDIGAGGDGSDGVEKILTVNIGGKTWMKKNLNIATEDSWCYDDSPDNCAMYGRLYTWDAAMTACPQGWHLPTDDEWTALTDYVGGALTAASKLKSTTGWNSGENGTNDYEFSALPGGISWTLGFEAIGTSGRWWTATEYDAGAWSRAIYEGDERVVRNGRSKDNLLSVRCIKDAN